MATIERVAAHDHQGWPLRGDEQYQCILSFCHLIAPPDIIYESIQVNRTGDGSKANITWTVLSLEVVESYVTFKIEYRSVTSSRKRQAEGGPMECSMSGCLIPYEQGAAIVTELDPEQTVSFSIQAQNEEGVQGMTLTQTAKR